MFLGKLSQYNKQIVKVNSDFDLEIFEPLLEIHPYDRIINSVIIGRVCARKSKLGGNATENGETVVNREAKIKENGNANGDAKAHGEHGVESANEEVMMNGNSHKWRGRD